MSKLCIQNLGLIITERCNLKCKHCLRGGSFNKDMGEDVIKVTLDQMDFIANLCICGGEVTLAIPSLEKVLTYIVDNKIPLGGLSTTINGTIYSEELLRLLDYIHEYIPTSSSGRKNVLFGISIDKFHEDEILRLGEEQQFIDNLNKYVQSPYFGLFREINKKLFREGRAMELDPRYTVPLHPYPVVYSYFKKKSVLGVGPLISINTNGIVTECDASIENQKTLYNYGNVLDEPLDVICKRIGTKVPSMLWFYKTGKIMEKHLTYNK